MKFSYIEKESRILGHVLKPLISIEILSKDDLWYGLDEVLVDTGADITLIPKSVGEVLVGDITSGKKAAIKGITPFELIIYIHNLKMKVMNKEIETSIAIADSDDVPAVLGRFMALDLFNAEFLKGKELILD
ncbi:MAG: hypothetical protein AABX14_03165 [Candidatus Aenigmatarchaeota archaeon]